MPRRSLAGGARAITIYLHPVTGGEWVWSLKGFPGYDFATEMARLGHASLVIDRLGYDSSDRPQGFDTCIGADADITHQIVEDLRAGTYVMDGGSGMRFERVALAGVSIGSLIVELEVASFSDVDAIVLSGWGDVVQPMQIVNLLPALPYAGRQCAAGDQTSEPDGTGPTGYVFPFPDPEGALPAFAYDPDPRVIAAVLPLLNRDPCGFYGSIANAAAASEILISTITEPVLFVIGDHDQVIHPEGARIRAAHYVASDDVTVALAPRAGHAPMFDRSVPEYRRLISDWLRLRGF
jgi:pimeloyl-ACP methyl ester carboxylesterase